MLLSEPAAGDEAIGIFMGIEAPLKVIWKNHNVFFDKED
jgi:hypothetical protein